MNTTLKTCFKCGLEKPITEFYRHKQMGDGYLNKCKSCARKDTNENRKKRIEYYREFDRSRANNPNRVSARSEYQKTQAWIDCHRKASDAWRLRNKDRRSASAMVNNALRNGGIKKLHCFVCGSEKTQGHHADYARPLDVIWLCSKHHADTHKLHKHLIRSERN